MYELYLFNDYTTTHYYTSTAEVNLLFNDSLLSEASVVNRILIRQDVESTTFLKWTSPVLRNFVTIFYSNAITSVILAPATITWRAIGPLSGCICRF